MVWCCVLVCLIFFFFNDTATTEIYTLSLHDALPIFRAVPDLQRDVRQPGRVGASGRSEEHTSELQSHSDLVCRLLLEKKKKKRNEIFTQKKKKKKNIIIMNYLKFFLCC